MTMKGLTYIEGPSLVSELICNSLAIKVKCQNQPKLWWNQDFFFFYFLFKVYMYKLWPSQVAWLSFSRAVQASTPYSGPFVSSVPPPREEFSSEKCGSTSLLCDAPVFPDCPFQSLLFFYFILPFPQFFTSL